MSNFVYSYGVFWVLSPPFLITGVHSPQTSHSHDVFSGNGGKLPFTKYIMIKIVSTASDKGADLSRIVVVEIDAVSVQGHFSKISTQAVNAAIRHLFLNALHFAGTDPEVQHNITIRRISHNYSTPS